MRRGIVTATVPLLAGLLLAGCRTAPAGAQPPAAPSPAAAQGAPERQPLAKFFANRDSNGGWRISPDGTRLAWIASYAGRSTIHVRTLDGAAMPINTHSSRSVNTVTWAADSRRLLYPQDRDGDEDFHVYMVSVETPEAWPIDLTPWPRSRSSVHRVIRDDPDHVVIESNRRDRSVFDLYRVSLTTHEATLIAENPGDVMAWMTDWDGRPRARLRHVGVDAYDLEVARDGGWQPVQRLDLEESDAHLLGATPDDRGVWLLSRRGRDRRALVRVDTVTGAESIVYEHPAVDVSWVSMSPAQRGPVAALTVPDYPVTAVFDRHLEALLATVPRPAQSGVWLLSLDRDERRVIVEVYTDKGSEFFLVGRDTAPVRLGRSHSLAFAHALGTMEPVTFDARDGLRLHGYLTRPPGFRAPGPMVLVIHGGHWGRDSWFYQREVQFLANRGYAVLQVNYRGSTGYGRRFAEAAVGEYAGKMHDDLIDGVRWAVAQGVADPRRVAVYGASYGGYATLVAMTFTPEVFACGVDSVGMSNLVTLVETAPTYWKMWMPFFHKYVGDPRRPEDRARMEAKSPLFKVDQARRPILILHGANDARVNVAESERMVEALRRAGKDVRFIVFGDEGHQRTYGNWRNALRHHAEMETFLADCLGAGAPGGG